MTALTKFLTVELNSASHRFVLYEGIFECYDKRGDESLAQSCSDVLRNSPFAHFIIILLRTPSSLVFVFVRHGST